jgi:hypothetical protein
VRAQRARLHGRRGAEVRAVYDVGERPKNRSECRGGLRPCPWISCRYHLLSEVGRIDGSLRVAGKRIPAKGSARAQIETAAERLANAKETCALDVADRGEHTLKQVGELMDCNVGEAMSRERIRQIEKSGLIRGVLASALHGITREDAREVMRDAEGRETPWERTIGEVIW